MSCNTRRRKLWKALSVDAEEMELLFRNAQKAAQGRGDITPDELDEWADKTRRVLALFDQQGIPCPVHSKTSDLPRRSAMAGYATLWDALAQDTRLADLVGAGRLGALGKKELIEALTELGQLALERGYQVNLVAVGGAAMIFGYSARFATKDVDVVVLSPPEARVVREIAKRIASERGWSEDWFNDGAKGYLKGISDGPVVFSAPGMQVRIPSPAQLLAMKLSAWRDRTDRLDAQKLLRAIGKPGDRDKIWAEVESYLTPAGQLKAYYAFLDLWELLYGDD